MLMPPEPIAGRRHVPHEQAGESHVVSADPAIRRVPTWVLVAVVPVVTVIAVFVTSLVSEDHAATSSSPAAPDTVVIKNFTFSPKPLTVRAGSTIMIVNDNNTTHTFTADNGAFDTGDVGGGERGRVTIDRARTYRYHCAIHPFMTGTARVSP
jgi:plastocyanin